MAGDSLIDCLHNFFEHICKVISTVFRVLYSISFEKSHALSFDKNIDYIKNDMEP